MYSIFLPLIIWATSEGRPFRRSHARQAFSFQCVFLAVWVVLVALMAAGEVHPLVLLAALGTGLVVELPQAARAVAGKPPIRFIPLEPLPA